MKKASFTFLGTGGSMGIPVVTCSCKVCTSSSPFNKRLRPSGLLNIHGKKLLIDAGPDFRLQALKFQIKALDGVLITHTHYDHVGGIDDLRVFHFLSKKSLSFLTSKETFEELKVRYHYLLEREGLPRIHIEFQILKEDFGSTEFLGIPIQFVSYYQREIKVTGFRFGSFAYISDIREYSPKVLTYLEGVETLILSALRLTPSEVHFSIDEAIDFVRKVKAKRTYFTHIAHDLDHEETNQKLPEDIRLGYDGLEIPLV